MSIIYDALKKVEKSFGKKTPEKNQTENQTVKPKNKNNPALIYILVILAGLFLGKIAISFFTRPKIIQPPPSAMPVITPADIAPPVEEEKPAPPPDPVLTLNGVYFQKNEGYALVNNRIIKIGDTIQGATVKAVTLDRVILEFEGREITLINSTR
ncbi:MAG: hypothetical protein JXL82_04695 [Candidatus Omnitrophica bacterium]|nr:hypothetical protein [Candidatus Omnitrophota bacterium]